MSKRFRLFQVALGLAAAVFFVMGLQAIQPNTPAGNTKGGGQPTLNPKQLAAKEKELADKYRQFQDLLLTLQQKLAASSDPKHKERAAQLAKALEQSDIRGIMVGFEEMVKFLSTQKLTKLGDANILMAKSARLAQDLKEILDLLRNTDSTANKREERIQLEKLVKELERLIREQKLVNARIETSTEEKNKVAEAQKEVRSGTQALDRNLGKLNKDEKGGKGGEAKNDKAEAKDGKGKGGKGESKDAGKGGEAKKGETKEGAKGGEGKAKEGKSGDPKAGDPKAGKQGEAKSGQGGDPKQGDAKAGKSGEGSQSKGGEAGKDDKKGEGKGSGDPKTDKQGEAKTDPSKVRTKPKEGEDKEGSAKKGGDQKSGQQGGAKAGDPKGGEKQSSEPKSGQSSQGQGQSKAGKSSQGQGQPKSGGQPKDGGEQPQGEQKGDGKQKEQDPQNPTADARKKIQDAEQFQRQAEQKIKEGEKKRAEQAGEEAEKNLEAARKKLEDLLRQLREEELERLLTDLKNRCEKMLAMQIQVYNGTKAVARAIDGNKDKKPTRANTQDSIALSDDEKKIVFEANKAIEMLEAEGSAVAFHEVFQQVREDMKHVERRLGATDVGKITQNIEEDIIDTLQEMIKALEKAKQDLDNKKPKDGQPSPPPPNQDQKLLDKIAELKMIRAMQIRVNKRTDMYGREFEGEVPNEPNLQREIRNLAERQERIVDVTRKIASGDNQ